MDSQHRMVRSAGLISALTFASRITGYLRDSLLAQMLGAANSSDAFIVAFRIPNLLRRLVGEGTLTAALIPTLSDYQTEDRKKEFWGFVSLVFTTLAVLVAILAAAGVVFSPYLVKALAYGFTGIEDKWDLTVSLNRLMFPYILFISLAAMAMATLNTVGIFGLPSATPILLNLSIIAVAWIFGRNAPEPAYAFAWGVLLGGVMQIAAQVPSMMRRGFRPSFRLSLSHPGIRQVGRLMIPGIFGLGVTQMTLVIDSQFASFLGRGAVSALYYAGRVNELALGVFAISVSTVILPSLSRYASAGDTREMRSTLLFGLRLVTFVTVPSAVGLIVLRREIIAALFKRGAFGDEAVTVTATALLYYSIGLVALGGIKVLAPAFYARKDTRTPVLVAAATLAAHLVLCTALSRSMGLGGIALADSISATLNMTMLLILIRRALGLEMIRSFVAPSLVFAAAAGAMGLLCRPVIAWLGGLLEGAPAGRFLALGITLVLMAAFYAGACRALGRPEPGRLIGALLPGRKS